VPLRKADGSLDYDEPAYKRALEAWKRLNGAVQPTLEGRDFKALQEKQNQEFIKDFKQENQNDKSLNRQIFDYSRGASLQEFQSFSDWAKTAGKKEISFPGSQTAGTTGPSGATGGTGYTSQKSRIQVPTGGFTGNEDPKPQTNTSGRINVYHSISGAEIGVRSRDSGEKPKAKMANPTPSRSPTSTNTDRTHDTQSIIDLYF
jgi:hypothetical protein